MFARVSRFQGGPGGAQPTEALRERMLPALRQIDGFRGLLALGDTATGRSLGITLWASEAAMAASRSAADTMRRDSADAFGDEIVDVTEYEVTLLEMEG